MNIAQSRKVEDWKVLTIAEPRLDAYIAEEFKASLLGELEDGTTRLILDLEQTEFMDSSGLGAIVFCLQKMQPGGRIAISGAREPVALMLRLTNIDKVLTLLEKPEDILQHST